MNESNDYEVDDDPFILERMPWLETPLDPQRPCIRILRIDPGVTDNPITCDLQVVSLDQNPEYESPSYVWGDATKTKPITVGGEIFKATENLANFLGCLRQENAIRVVWADAICIDHSNDEEKSHQIGLMTRIYCQAKEAHVWLGPFTESCTDEIRGDTGEFIPICEWTPDDWDRMEIEARQKLLVDFQIAGGKALPQHESTGPNLAILPETLAMLDEIAEGKHFHQLPIFFTANDGPKKSPQYVVNRHLFEIHDCFRWLLSRPWWSRVWTLQEAVLPQVDSIVHAYPYSFPLSKLFNGIKGINEHSTHCCKRATSVSTT